MPIKQISISLENVPGKFSEVIDYLAENEISIFALSVADTADLSIVRLVTNHPERAANVLRTQGYSVKMTEVLAVEAANHPGGLDAILRPLKQHFLNINYLYTCLKIGERTVLIVDVDNKTEAMEILRKNGVQLYGEELYKM
jgi:hypothetical protein